MVIIIYIKGDSKHLLYLKDFISNDKNIDNNNNEIKSIITKNHINNITIELIPNFLLLLKNNSLLYQLLLPGIASFNTLEIEINLPFIILFYSNNLELLKDIFVRITKCRPPPLTKANLLVYLHR